jgi:YHS domain-containing protein
MVMAACGGSGSSRVASKVLTDDEGVAIGGYDPVAYFNGGKAQMGTAEHAADWNGARWWFVSEANRNSFLDSPDRFAPAYGGWCAYGMAEGYAAESDPVNGWTIHEGRLYLNWDAEVTSDWRKSKASYLRNSESNWPEVEAQLEQGSATVYWHDD